MDKKATSYLFRLTDGTDTNHALLGGVEAHHMLLESPCMHIRCSFQLGKMKQNINLQQIA